MTCEVKCLLHLDLPAFQIASFKDSRPVDKVSEYYNLTMGCGTLGILTDMNVTE